MSTMIRIGRFDRLIRHVLDQDAGARTPRPGRTEARSAPGVVPSIGTLDRTRASARPPKVARPNTSRFARVVELLLR